MRRVNYDTYQREKSPALVRKRVAVLNTISERLPRQRPRDPEEEALLRRQIRARHRRLLDSGELVCHQPRRWRWRFPEFE